MAEQHELNLAGSICVHTGVLYNFRQEMRGSTLIQRKTAPVRGQRLEAAGNARRRRRAGGPVCPLPAAVRGMAGSGTGRRASCRLRSGGGVPAHRRHGRASRARHPRCRRARWSGPASGLCPGPRRWPPRSTSRGRAPMPCTISPAWITWRCARPWSLPRAGTPARGQPKSPRRVAGESRAAAWSASSRVQAVTRSAGAPAPHVSVVYLRVYATRVTTTPVSRQVTSDGVTVELTRSSGRWPGQAPSCSTKSAP